VLDWIILAFINNLHLSFVTSKSAVTWISVAILIFIYSVHCRRVRRILPPQAATRTYEKLQFNNGMCHSYWFPNIGVGRDEIFDGHSRSFRNKQNELTGHFSDSIATFVFEYCTNVSLPVTWGGQRKGDLH